MTLEAAAGWLDGKAALGLTLSVDSALGFGGLLLVAVEAAAGGGGLDWPEVVPTLSLIFVV